MKLVFLDFDGVLNTPRTWGNRPLIHAIDEVRVANLQRLIDATDAEIVITSTWRKSVSMPLITEMLADKGLKKAPLSHTPILHRHRVVEIVDWFDEFLAAHTVPIEAFTILDDNTADDATSVWTLMRSHWVEIDPWVGFHSDEYFALALEHLNATVPGTPATADSHS